MTNGGDEEIIRGYLEGQASAHRTVDRWIRPLVQSRHWGLREERDDILQEIRRRLFENLLNEKFHRSSSLKTYVSQMAKYVCIEFLRRRKRTRTSDFDLVSVEDPSPSPEGELSGLERRQLLLRALARLPEGCRELFDLIFVSELSYDDISHRLGIAPGTVKSRAFRCRESLSRLLEGSAPKSPGAREPAPPGRH